MNLRLSASHYGDTTTQTEHQTVARRKRESVAFRHRWTDDIEELALPLQEPFGDSIRSDFTRFSYATSTEELYSMSLTSMSGDAPSDSEVHGAFA